MATEGCRDWRGDLGLEAIGALDEPERTALLAHVDGCADCRATLAELTTVGKALDLADASRVDDVEPLSPPHELGERILGRLQWERAAHRRRRARRGIAAIVGVAAAAAAAVVALVIVVVGVVGVRGGGEHGTVVALRSSEKSVHAQAVLYREEAGVRVRLRVEGLDDGEWYWLWVTGADGKRVGAGTFSASNLRENLTMTAALSLPRTHRVWVTDAQDHVVLDGFVPAT